MNTGREQYLQALAGLRETTRTQAERVARLLAKQGEVQVGQASRAAEDLLRRTRSNREQLSRLLQREVKRQLGAVGIATREEVARLQQRVRALEQAAQRPSRPAGAGKRPASPAPPRRRARRHGPGPPAQDRGRRPPRRAPPAVGAAPPRPQARATATPPPPPVPAATTPPRAARRLAHRSIPTAHAAGVAAAPILERHSGFRHRGPAERGRRGSLLGGRLGGPATMERDFQPARRIRSPSAPPAASHQPANARRSWCGRTPGRPTEAARSETTRKTPAESPCRCGQSWSWRAPALPHRPPGPRCDQPGGSRLSDWPTSRFCARGFAHALPVPPGTTIGKWR